MDLFFGMFWAFWGALAGLVCPPRNPSWARAQKIGWGLLAGAILAWLAAYGATRLLSSPTASCTLAILGVVNLVGYLGVGNVCRRQYERYLKCEKYLKDASSNA